MQNNNVVEEQFVNEEQLAAEDLNDTKLEVSDDDFENEPCFFTVIPPEDIRYGFNDIFGLQKCKEELQNILHFLKNPDMYSERGVIPYCKYLLMGAEGVGKTTLASAVAKEANLPLVIVEPWFFCCKDKECEIIEDLFILVDELCEQNSNCVLLFKAIEYTVEIPQEQFLPVMGRILWHLKNKPQLIAFATVTTGNEMILSPSFIEKGAFTKTLILPEPELDVREKIVKFLLKDIPLKRGFDQHRVTHATFGLTFGEIKKLLNDAQLISLQNKNEKLTFADFSEALSRSELGNTRAKLSDEEKLSTARHEAGHVVAAYFASEGKNVATQVEINNREFSLGATSNPVDEKKKTYFKPDLEQQIISLFGGMASEEIFYGSTSTGVSQDLVQATAIAKNMYKVYGMSKVIGPIALSTDPPLVPTLDRIADEEIRRYLCELYHNTIEILLTQRSALEELSETLFAKEILHEPEIRKILEKYNK